MKKIVPKCPFFLIYAYRKIANSQALDSFELMYYICVDKILFGLKKEIKMTNN